MGAGLIAGSNAREACSIESAPALRQAGVSFVCAEITGLDLTRPGAAAGGTPPLRWTDSALMSGL